GRDPEGPDGLEEDKAPHLVTAWRLDEDGQRDMVGDVTYALDEVLWLAGGGFHTTDGTPVDSFMATMNAQTFAYFAVAYWYSVLEWVGKKTGLIL
ncbi:hypothetical protein N7471_007587, partial [Penicillium samsonianum]|uniref:uncharacterized protein n=1 Tax=Penicillium samsonianum TaxID=1882272 RepID=UPI002549B7AA